ncbi:hypothetical protein F5050DRAFT_1232086 [Lentinula boryana]|uniref:Uncharacterized protein n=1 Tax=Lentinula boryana TaxID=40481 RepID=A0ABQ8QIR2_9AGAR|nr:hypothetical protein F5050DRAFT_1232086 [Lentinula boryana]
MPLEAQVTLSGSPLSEEDRAALKSAIEKMLNLKAALSLFKGSVVDLLKDTRPKLNIKAVKNVKEIPVTVIDYEPSSGKKSTSNTEYQFKFTFAGKPAGPDTTFDFGGYYFSGFIERASLSNGGKQLTGSFYGRDTETGSWNKLVWFTAGQGKVRGHFTDLLDCWAAEWVQIKKKLGMGKNLQNLARCPGHFLG